MMGCHDIRVKSDRNHKGLCALQCTLSRQSRISLHRGIGVQSGKCYSRCAGYGAFVWSGNYLLLHEAFLVFRKWACENTPLLICGQSPLNKLAMLGLVELAERDVVKFRIQGFGFIDFYLSREVRFQYFDPAAQPNSPSRVVDAEDHSSEPPATGAGIVAVTPTGETLMALEILGA